MADMREQFDAIKAGGICIQALSLSTRQGTTTVSHATSLWHPHGRGRIVFEHGALDVPFEKDLIAVLVNVIAQTDWARRAYRSPGLDTQH